jgi:hypothetical protein
MMRSLKSVGTYRVIADSTAQAIKVAEEYRKKGWRCTSRGRRLVLTTSRDEHLSPLTRVTIWQVDHTPHEVACREFLVPELRGRRPSSAGLEGEHGHAGDQEVEDNHREGR